MEIYIEWNFIAIVENIIKKYKSFNKPIVFGAELYCWPDSDKASLYDTQNEYFKYLNSGLYIGTAGTIKSMLINYKGGEDVDDQRFWTEQYFANKDKIALDTKAELFLNCADMDNERRIPSRDAHYRKKRGWINWSWGNAGN